MCFARHGGVALTDQEIEVDAAVGPIDPRAGNHFRPVPAIGPGQARMTGSSPLTPTSERGEGLRPGAVDRDDLVETADLEDLRD